MQAVEKIQHELYISYSQMFTYQTCPLKYKFQYVVQEPPERLSSALPFGRAIHSSLELYYREIQTTGVILPLERIQAVFRDNLVEQVECSTVPIIYKKDAQDFSALLVLGEAMLKAFYEKVDLTGCEIIGIEVPLSAPLYTEDRELLDIKLYGVLDLIIKDISGNLLCIDNKTAKAKKSQSAVDEDLQLTTYSYLLAANKYAFPRSQINCGFQVLRKLKKPTIEYYYTTRTAEHRKKFAHLVSSILHGIENRVFYPVTSWMCGDCQYKEACKSW